MRTTLREWRGHYHVMRYKVKLMAPVFVILTTTTKVPLGVFQYLIPSHFEALHLSFRWSVSLYIHYRYAYIRNSE